MNKQHPKQRSWDALLIQTKTAHQFTFKEPTIIPLDAEVIPLYTHPVKELTDEEIEDLIDSVIPMILLGGRIFYRDFAKAILRKAQEKC
jgi:hypothetical protein